MIDLPTIYDASTQQRVYRALLDVHSFPGKIVDLSDCLEGEPAYLGVIATLADHSSSLCDAEGLLARDEVLRIEAAIKPMDQADYALFKADLAPPTDYTPRLGDVYQPHLGATLILFVDALGRGHDVYELTGPGIEDTKQLALTGLDQKWFERRQAWVADYPMGVDIVLCDRSRIAALPRTTRISAAERMEVRR